MESDKVTQFSALQAPFPTSMAGLPLAGQSVGPQFCAPSTAAPAPSFVTPSSYSPTPVQTQGYALAANPGGYAPVPGQAPYYGPPYSDQSGYSGQGFGAGPGFGPPAGYVHVGGAPSVVTTQIVSGPGVTMLQVPPANNSLIVSSMVLSITACICALFCGFVPWLCAIPALILSSIGLCSAPAMTNAQAERKNTFARIGLIFSILAILCGAVIISFVVIQNSNQSVSKSASRFSGQYCSPPSYVSNAHECTWQRDTWYSSSTTILSCCCKAGYSSRPDCYIDGTFSSRSTSMCKKCGPIYSD